jgi:hypothetical protein
VLPAFAANAKRWGAAFIAQAKSLGGQFTVKPVTDITDSDGLSGLLSDFGRQGAA